MPLRNIPNRFSIGQHIHLDTTEYVIENVTEGGMGAVYFLNRQTASNGFDPVYRRRLAAKAVKSGELSREYLRVFENEINKWIALDHPNILRLIKLIHYNGTLLAIMPVCSASVREVFRNPRSLKLAQLLRLIDQVISALEYSSARHGLLHLDLKPENILVDFSVSAEPSYFVSDWGTASIQAVYANTQAEGTRGGSAQETYARFGTLPYMSPERFLESPQLTCSADIFSLGMIMLELVSGRLPFNFHSKKPLTGQLFDLDYLMVASSLLESQPSKRLRHLILKAIYPDPTARYSDYRTFRRDLGHAQGVFARMKQTLI
jgi:serine/threonine protein kinase